MRSAAVCLALCALAGCANLIPAETADISDLTPATILCIQGRGPVTVTVDGGLQAEGDDLAHALQQLREAAPGRLLLETVDQVVWSDGTPETESLRQEGIRPAARLYTASVSVENPEELSNYLSHHPGSVTLASWQQGTELPRLYRDKQGLYLPRKEQK